MNAPNNPNVVFWERTEVRREDECWPWRGGVTCRGYGTLWVKGKLRKASHIALEIDGRPRPGKSLALHSCDNPICVNPSHLRWGNHQENADDKVARGRWRGGNPTKRLNFKATPEMVAKVLASSEGSTTLARRLGVSKPTVLRIRRKHGIVRRQRPPTVMMDRVQAHLMALADADALVTVKQTDVAAALGLASSNINNAIRLLIRDGLVERVHKCRRTGVWTYRMVRVA